MRVLVTGRDGQVARSLAERARGNVDVTLLGRPELDLAAPASDIVAAIAAAKPDVIVSAAAYTQVDRAETDEELAFTINRDGARAVAEAARDIGVPLLHLSTDYVFDGLKTSPYVEDDATGPTGVYGASKLAGEHAVLSTHQDSVVLRTAWVYSPFGTNFVKTMLRLAHERDEIRVVADQRGNATSALDIADAVLQVAMNLRSDASRVRRGIFHMVASGETSWAEFAEAIFAVSSEIGGPSAQVTPIRTADYPTPAKRPANSRLDSSKLERVHGVLLPNWRTSLHEVVSRLVDVGV